MSFQEGRNGRKNTREVGEEREIEEEENKEEQENKEIEKIRKPQEYIKERGKDTLQERKMGAIQKADHTYIDIRIESHKIYRQCTSDYKVEVIGRGVDKNSLSNGINIFIACYLLYVCSLM